MRESNDKALRLIEYLLNLASLRNKLRRDVAEYNKVLWLSDIPKQKNCFTQAWGKDQEYSSDIWIEVQNRKEPELPSIPNKCEGWIEKSSLRRKEDLPELKSERNYEIKNPLWKEGNNQNEYINITENIEDHPEVQKEWENYLEESWLPWVENHNSWERVHKIYSELFTIHQEQLRLGEEYELVLGIGLLTWKTPSEQRIRRHLIVADAMLEFEAKLGKFIVRVHPEGSRLRPELDMLDANEKPINAEGNAKEALNNSTDDPWDNDCIDSVLKALIHSIDPNGEYIKQLTKKDLQASSKPVVEYAPALVLRKRSTKGLTETLKMIKTRIEENDYIPDKFKDLAEIQTSVQPEINTNHESHHEIFEGEVFFPKPANEEQYLIVEKFRSADAVHVQGPPGTGKSHTISNMISHLLATGQRTLITAKTPRALKVIEKLIPSQLRPLCINLLGSGSEERRSLEASVVGILNKNQKWDESKNERQKKLLTNRLESLREEQAKVNRRILYIKESETHTQVVAEGAYKGTAAQIAKIVNQEQTNFEWFTDRINYNTPCPFGLNEFKGILKELRYFTTEKHKELTMLWPEEFSNVDEIRDLFENEKKLIKEEENLKKDTIKELVNQLKPKVAKCGSCSRQLEFQFNKKDFSSDEKQILDCQYCGKQNYIKPFSTIEGVKELKKSLLNFSRHYQQIAMLNQTWIKKAVDDVFSNNSNLWYKVLKETKNIIASIEDFVEIADNTALEIPEKSNINILYDDALKMKNHIENGGKLGWWIFRTKFVKEHLYLIESVRINGRPCTQIEDFSLLCNVLFVKAKLQKAWDYWLELDEKKSNHYALQLVELKSMCENLQNILFLEDEINKCRNDLRNCGLTTEPVWNDLSQIKMFIHSCQLVIVQNHKRYITEKIQHIEDKISQIAANNNVHSITTKLLDVVRERKLNDLANISSKIQELNRDKKNLQKLGEDLSKISTFLPKLTEELKKTFDDKVWNKRLDDIKGAWQWAQAKYWLEEYTNKDDLPSLSKRSMQIDEEINHTIAELASIYAWSFCFSRLTEEHRRHMEAWRQSMSRLGKGTGKYASRYRREAQYHLNQCRDAVPSWVMPLHRVWDTVEPVPEIFDVIIVDEASQCGFESFPLFYLAKKIVIVGDDKQISPEAVGLSRENVNRYKEEFLYDFQFSDSFNIESSLFDHAQLRYGTQRITLREHFRCMPEIIKFSNELCYSNTSLIPLRQYGADRLPPLRQVFVEQGYREGNHNRTINRPEAKMIVEKISELCAENIYSGKSFGVIVLQGEAQAGYIEDLLLDEIGAEEMEKRNLVCGNPYSFQGDERDVIFMSMVAAPNMRIQPLAKSTDERRFNVAASRAKDQLWLFHSVQLGDLSEKDLRRKLLEFFYSTEPKRIAGINMQELEYRAKRDNRSIVTPPDPFDSWFEVDVALELKRRGFEVTPQFEVAGKWIDLVVEGGHARLAVECDGDHWHGSENYDDDMQRQRQLERCGWEFFRIRESAFYANKENAMSGLLQALEERGISPHSRGTNQSFKSDSEGDESEDYTIEEENGEYDDVYSSQNAVNNSSQSGRRVEDISTAEIQDAILLVLEKSPNHSCALHSLTSRVLKEIGVLTRGNPRIKFEKRVMRSVNHLNNSERIEKYKAKNKRIRLIK